MQRFIYGVQLDLDDEQRHLFQESMDGLDPRISFITAHCHETNEFKSFIYLKHVDIVIKTRLAQTTATLSLNEMKDILALCCGVNRNLGDFRTHNLINNEMRASLKSIVDQFISDGAPVDFGDGVRTIGEYGWHLINVQD